MKEKAELPPYLLQHTPWEDEINPIWPASSFILHRNLVKYNFPGKLNEKESQQLLQTLQQALLKSPDLKNPQLLRAEALSPIDKEFLFEHFLSLESFQNTFAGQGFVVDESAHFLGMINIQDHLQLQWIDSRGEWENIWNRLSKIESSLSTEFDYAFSPRFGYLTADPSLCGTGLVVVAYLHLAALNRTGQLQDTLIKQKDENVEAIGMEGKVEELVGDMVLIKNKYTLGIDEASILQSVQATAMKLIVAEKGERAHIKEKNNAAIKDLVSRAYGLLVHSYQLQTKEALDALSLIKLGADLGWIEGVTDAILNETFFKCRRAHLALLSKEPSASPEEVARQRASFLHKQLAGMKLKTE